MGVFFLNLQFRIFFSDEKIWVDENPEDGRHKTKEDREIWYEESRQHSLFKSPLFSKLNQAKLEIKVPKKS